MYVEDLKQNLLTNLEPVISKINQGGNMYQYITINSSYLNFSLSISLIVKLKSLLLNEDAFDIVLPSKLNKIEMEIQEVKIQEIHLFKNHSESFKELKFKNAEIEICLQNQKTSR